MRLFSRKHSRCCLASWRKNRRISPLAGKRIFLACFESLCPKYVWFNISHWLTDSLHIYAKFSGQYLSGALLGKRTWLPGQLLSGARHGEPQPAPGEVTTGTEPSWFVWPRMGVSWEERDGKATPRLQGPSQYSPPGLVTFCQSLCCVFIDARNQAGVRVFLSAPHSRVSTSLEEKSCLPFPEMRSVLWHFTLMSGPLHFPALVADPWKYPTDALAFCVEHNLQGLEQPSSPVLTICLLCYNT